MSEDFLKDFDVLSPPKRFAKIGGEKIDVTIIPTRAAFMFTRFSEKYPTEIFKKMEAGDSSKLDPEMIEGIMDVIEAVCKRSSEKITKDWLLDNVDFSILMQFVDYVFAGMQEDVSDVPESQGDDEKN
jgi:hypothetical protein